MVALRKFLWLRSGGMFYCAVARSHRFGANGSGSQALSKGGQQLPIGLAQRTTEANLRSFPIGKSIVERTLALGRQAVQASIILADLHSYPAALARIGEPSG